MSRAALCLLAACATHAAPTVSGAEIYAHLAELQQHGAVTVGTSRVFETSVLTTEADGPSYVVSQVIAHCKGGDPSADVDCTLALLLDQSFGVADRVPDRRNPTADRSDRGSSFLSSTTVIGLAVGVTAGLIYEDATCSFPGCKAVFTIPLVFIGAAALFATGKD